MAEQTGAFQITSSTRVVAQGAAAVEAARLIETLAPALGFRLLLEDTPTKPDQLITLSLDASLSQKLGAEATP